MIYTLFRGWANIAIRVFYGKIEVDGIENIPKGVPMLIASNHPNGFLEPIIMACLFPRPLHFMVRGDVFRKKWLKPILVQTNQIPIFRFKDGFAELRKNDANLQEAYKALDKEAAIILFIEGGTINIKKLRPFQKGLARMASSYLNREESRQDLMILPVAINFISPFVLRSRVVLNVGKPYDASTYFKDAENNTVHIKKLTDDLYQQIKPMAFHVSDDSRQPILNTTLKWAEGLCHMPFYPIVSYKTKYWSFFKSIANAIDEMDEGEFEEFSKDIHSLGPIKDTNVKRMSRYVWINFIITFICFIPAMVGLVVNIIPGMAAQLLAKKKLSKDNTVFRASIILSSGVGFYVVYYVLMILLLSFFFGWYSLYFLLGWPLGFIYLLWKNALRSSVLKRKYHLSSTQKDHIISLLTKYTIQPPKI
ncbi:MAG: 1-acyl-sn-glycerol-3-phosphate acyltransferase [Saprospiraceae bacterium]|nr:1-acyl-sn-glycerol-3-phosphate acyltransferase [Saprospiraceae bacterium]